MLGSALISSRKLLSNATVRTQRRWLSSKHTYQDPSDIGFFKAYGRPVITIFLWSSVTYLSLQSIWSKLYLDELKIETESKIDALKNELSRLQK